MLTRLMVITVVIVLPGKVTIKRSYQCHRGWQTWFPLYIWWSFCQICTYSLGSGVVRDLISWIRLKAQRKLSLIHICWLFKKKKNQISVKVCFVFALCTNHISLFISLVLSGRLPFCLGPFSYGIICALMFVFKTLSSCVIISFTTSQL